MRCVSPVYADFANEYISFAPFYRLSGDKRVMVYRRRYYYNGRSFISVVYFGRLRTSFCHCASRKIIYFANFIASIITTTPKAVIAVGCSVNIYKYERCLASNFMLHFAINKYLSQFINFNFRIPLNNILIF